MLVAQKEGDNQFLFFCRAVEISEKNALRISSLVFVENFVSKEIEHFQVGFVNLKFIDLWFSFHSIQMRNVWLSNSLDHIDKPVIYHTLIKQCELHIIAPSMKYD